MYILNIYLFYFGMGYGHKYSGFVFYFPKKPTGLVFDIL